MTARDLERLDVQLADLIEALRIQAGCLAEQAHQMDPFDAAFARLACEHGDRCSTPDTYPTWTPRRAS
ncbi:hypothetical protein [Streptomyces filamentosus]|uniref:Uncharacterized protein n=1 Tax=Streptomyces filamentosus TaxID=67294 RepID=A0A919ETB2_STRFL|nr:hypothetical protein [Streptomyces filamentosus]GHG30923.1 hypothetical protein GCM10017667_80570 [Streptomyces filamentosus]GHG31956.1 hypothetical protein GCM10017667_82350 [Streptomyces filamentosus]